MKIGIVVTKRHKNSDPIYGHVERGIRMNGDTPVFVDKQTDLRFLKTCRVAFQIGEMCHTNKTPTQTLRWQTALWAQQEGKRRVVIDTGYLHNCKSKTSNTYYVSMGFDGIKAFGNYYNTNSPPDRFKKLNMEIKPWRESGRDILIAGINNTGWNSTFYDDGRWTSDVVRHVITNSTRRVIIKSHPNSNKKFINSPQIKALYEKYGEGRVFMYPQRAIPFTAILKNIHCCVSTGSNSTVEALVNGVPIVCPLAYNIAYGMGSITIKDMDKLFIPQNRESFLNDIAYAQWNYEEIGTGEAWAHLRKHLDDPPAHNSMDVIKYARSYSRKYKLPK